MTQPQQNPPAAQPGNTATLVATTALTLALIHVESEAREQVDDDIQIALAVISAALLIALASPTVVYATGTELLADARVHAELTRQLELAREHVTATAQGAYDAVSHITLMKIRKELAEPVTMPQLPDTLDVILRDIDTMFGHALTDIQNTVRAAYDGVQGEQVDAARVVLVKQAVTDAGKRLAQRAQAATTTAVYHSSRDTAQGIYSDYQNTTGTAGLMKRWVATARDPCGMCDALNGTLVGLSAEFDHDASTNDKDFRPVWRNLLGPPRHPRCRCLIELVKT